MRLFADANILVSVLNKEYPLFPFTSRILSLASEKGFRIYTSPVCLAIAFYFAEKKHSTLSAKQKIDILCRHISIAENTSAAIKKSNDYPLLCKVAYQGLLRVATSNLSNSRCPKYLLLNL